MPTVNYTVELPISWTFDVCILKNYMLQGQAKDQNGDNQFVQMYVPACDVDDVCRRLRDRNFEMKITYMAVYNNKTVMPYRSQLLFVDTPTVVTPNISDCQFCCDYLDDFIPTPSITPIAFADPFEDFD